LGINDKKKFLVEALDKNMLYIPLSEMEDKTFGIEAKDRKLSSQFYGLTKND
jgi:adenine-specific DNA-methyltransferase